MMKLLGFSTKVLTAFFSFALVVVPSVCASASTPPMVTWERIQNSEITSATFDLNAIDEGDEVVKWCVFVDGSPLNYDAATLYSGDLESLIGTRFLSGCYVAIGAPYNYLHRGSLTFDSSRLSLGYHTFSIQSSTNDGIASALSSVTLLIDAWNSYSNVGNLTWVSPSPSSSFSGMLRLIARAPDLTRNWSKWCFTVDGSPLKMNKAINPSDLAQYAVDGTWTDTTFDTSSGCYHNGSGRSLAYGVLTFFTDTWTTGTHVFSLQGTDFSGRAGQPISLTLTYQPNSTPPAPVSNAHITWNSNLSNLAWLSGSNVDVGGKISGSKTFPKFVKMRSSQPKKGWSSWRTVSVAKSGYFHSSFNADRQLDVQVITPAWDQNSQVKGETFVDIYGQVKISAPSHVAPGTQIWFKVTTNPKWSGQLNCNFSIDRFDYYGNSIGSSYGYPTITIRNGYGTLNPGATKYVNTNVNLSCAIDWDGLTVTDGGTGSATVSVY